MQARSCIIDLVVTTNLKGDQDMPKVTGFAKRGRITYRGLRVDVRIVDTRTAYGRKELLVRPVSGVGSTWIAVHNVEVK
jgi:hypothetical protein